MSCVRSVISGWLVAGVMVLVVVFAGRGRRRGARLFCI